MPRRHLAGLLAARRVGCWTVHPKRGVAGMIWLCVCMATVTGRTGHTSAHVHDRACQPASEQPSEVTDPWVAWLVPSSYIWGGTHKSTSTTLLTIHFYDSLPHPHYTLVFVFSLITFTFYFHQRLSPKVVASSLLIPSSHLHNEAPERRHCRWHQRPPSRGFGRRLGRRVQGM